MEKKRLDVLLYELGYAPSRKQAAELIRAGCVLIGGQPAKKPSFKCDAKSGIAVTQTVCPYVSRGGQKLEGALDAFGIRLEGRTCLDVGASTGGFTDCMLRRGAARVYAVDGGTGQLHPELRADGRVLSLERTDIRALPADGLEPVSFAAVDVSFISLRLVLPHIRRFCAGGAEILLLVKPQFEAGRSHVGKGGIVKSEAVRRRVVEELAAFALGEGFLQGRAPAALTAGPVQNSMVSPIKGGDGNIEFFLFLLYNGEKPPCGNAGTDGAKTP